MSVIESTQPVLTKGRKSKPAAKWRKIVGDARTNHATKGKRVEALWVNYDPKSVGDQALKEAFFSLRRDAADL